LKVVMACSFEFISIVNFVSGAALPLTKRAQAFDFVSCGLAILSHKGRGSVLEVAVMPRGEATPADLPLPLWERIRRPGEHCEPHH
jgi:hypothetical protein